jgi:hypothetical protein
MENTSAVAEQIYRPPIVMSLSPAVAPGNWPPTEGPLSQRGIGVISPFDMAPDRVPQNRHHAPTPLTSKQLARPRHRRYCPFPTQHGSTNRPTNPSRMNSSCGLAPVSTKRGQGQLQVAPSCVVNRAFHRSIIDNIGASMRNLSRWMRPA